MAMRGGWLRESHDAVVVFAHGVLSSSETCWRNEGGAFWPQLVADDPLAKNVGIYVYSYRTGVFTGTYRLGDVVDDLKERMRLDGVSKCKTIVFVAHSMGGIVVRKLVVERADDFRETNLGLFLVASPSLGSDYANILKPLARLFGHAQADVLRFSQENAWLMDLDKEFRNVRASERLTMSGKELAEDVFIALPGFIQRQVVQPFSATAYFGEPYKVPGSNHFTIAKPSDADAIQHRLLVEFIGQVRAKVRPTLERDLRSRLGRRLQACQGEGLAFRAFHKLDAIFSMPTGFAAACLDRVRPGGSAAVVGWLRESVRDQASSQGDRESSAVPLDEDAHVEKAAEIAVEEWADAIDERHLLLAVLGDHESGTVLQLEQFLGEGGLDRFVGAVRTRRPKASALSRTPMARPIGGVGQ